MDRLWDSRIPSNKRPDTLMLMEFEPTARHFPCPGHLNSRTAQSVFYVEGSPGSEQLRILPKSHSQLGTHVCIPSTALVPVPLPCCCPSFAQGFIQPLLVTLGWTFERQGLCVCLEGHPSHLERRTRQSD